MLPFTIQLDTYIWALSLTEAIDRLVLLFSPNSRDSVQNFNLLFFWFIVLLNYSANEIKSGQQQCSISSNHLFGTPSEAEKRISGIFPSWRPLPPAWKFGWKKWLKLHLFTKLWSLQMRENPGRSSFIDDDADDDYGDDGNRQRRMMVMMTTTTTTMMMMNQSLKICNV